MYYTNFDKVLESIFESNSPVWENKSTTFVPSKFAVDITDEKAVMALAVLGHDENDIEINCYEDKIEIKSNKSEDKSPYNQLVSKIEERITIGKNFDGRDAKAEIKNGILTITLDRKEDSKPKKVKIKVG